jgi:hypothetical protein
MKSFKELSAAFTSYRYSVNISNKFQTVLPVYKIGYILPERIYAEQCAMHHIVLKRATNGVMLH